MTGWLAAAFRRALAGLVLCFGLLAVLFTATAEAWSPSWTLPKGPFELPFPNHSPWDIPVAIGLAAASILVAVAIYPARRRQRRRARGVVNDLRVLQR